MKANRLSGLLLFLIFIATVFRFSARAAEPSYNGKPLSEWLVVQDTAAQQDAIQQMGTNCIPTLLDILGAKEWNKKRVVSKLKSKAFKEYYGQQAAEDIRYYAVDGFTILGTNAESAVPQLVKLLHDPETCSEAARVLTQVGPKGFSVLTNSINDEDLAGVVVLALGQKGGGDPQAITRLLITALKSPDSATRGNAADFLSGKDATLAIPALIPILDDNEYYPRERAIIALGRFGPVAKDAAPKLFSIYTNQPDVFVMGALKGIDMETAAKAEDFLVNLGPLGANHGNTTTPLPNAKTLIAGGFLQTTIPTTNNYVFSRAVLFDPTTRKRTETGSMNVARYGHTATLLPNGKVLIAGGEDAKGNYLSSAELYDPMTGKWAETGSMNTAHAGGSAVLQHDGKVLVSGELYDPVTGTWTVVTNK